MGNEPRPEGFLRGAVADFMVRDVDVLRVVLLPDIPLPEGSFLVLFSLGVPEVERPAPVLLFAADAREVPEVFFVDVWPDFAPDVALFVVVLFLPLFIAMIIKF